MRCLLKLHQFNVNAGGLGGQPGFYVFISTVTDAAHKPKSITNAGPNGPNGPDAAVCKTNAAEVHVDWSDKKKDWGMKIKLFFFITLSQFIFILIIPKAREE